MVIRTGDSQADHSFQRQGGHRDLPFTHAKAAAHLWLAKGTMAPSAASLTSFQEDQAARNILLEPSYLAAVKHTVKSVSSIA
jgi:hypothetical protein